MVVLAEVVRSEVRVTEVVVDSELDQRFHSCKCWPRLQCNLQDSVHILITLSELEELWSDPLCHA